MIIDIITITKEIKPGIVILLNEALKLAKRLGAIAQFDITNPTILLEFFFEKFFIFVLRAFVYISADPWPIINAMSKNHNKLTEESDESINLCKTIKPPGKRINPMTLLTIGPNLS